MKETEKRHGESLSMYRGRRGGESRAKGAMGGRTRVKVTWHLRSFLYRGHRLPLKYVKWPKRHTGCTTSRSRINDPKWWSRGQPQLLCERRHISQLLRQLKYEQKQFINPVVPRWAAGRGETKMYNIDVLLHGASSLFQDFLVLH